MGFSVPIHEWIRGPLSEWCEELLNKDRLKSEGFFDEEIVFQMEDEIFNTCKSFSLKNKNQEKNLIEMVKQNCRRIVRDKTGKKRFTNINIARL